MVKNQSTVNKLRIISVISLISPIIIYWLLNENYESYIWLINSPGPFSMLGSGPLQLLLYITLLLIGIVTAGVSVILHNKKL